ncbi:ctr copper transporter family domain-containing protein [Ditylenchus destructor]|nr:ctr copper transporter family domain-containing protein [Ditylenchus destructor]
MQNVSETFATTIANFTTTAPPSTTEAVTATTLDLRTTHAQHHHHDHNPGTEHQMHFNTPDANDHAAHGMKMYFHAGCSEVILFDCWRIDSCFGLIVSCLLIFILAACYEGIKWFRVYFQMWCTNGDNFCRPINVSMKDLENRSVEDALIQKSCNANGDNGGLLSSEREQQVYVPTVTSGEQQPRTASRFVFNFLNRWISRSSPFVTHRIAEALLYGIQLIIAYWLMLIIMTYNVYLTGAVVFGAAFGYWLFTGLLCMSPFANTVKHKHALEQSASDACH